MSYEYMIKIHGWLEEQNYFLMIIKSKFSDKEV